LKVIYGQNCDLLTKGLSAFILEVYGRLHHKRARLKITNQKGTFKNIR